MGQLLKWYGMVKRQKSRGTEYRKGQRDVLKPKVCLLAVCAQQLCGPGHSAMGGQCWQCHRVQILLGSGALLLSFSYSHFYEVKPNMKTNSQVTEGSLALDDAFAGLEGSMHCFFPIHIL